MYNAKFYAKQTDLDPSHVIIYTVFLDNTLVWGCMHIELFDDESGRATEISQRLRRGETVCVKMEAADD
jgi:hypothetical protein